MNEDEIWMINPDYLLKPDIDRICLYSTRDLKYDSSLDWTSYIHPFQAIILYLFNGENTLSEIYNELSSHFNISIKSAQELIRPFLGNNEPIYSEYRSERVLFPKNILIPKNILNGDIPLRNRDRISINANNISLSMDRAHRAPHSILWMLTNRCITNCAYCYADRKTPYIPMSTDKCMEIIEEAYVLGIKHIDVIGGEIFLRENWDILIKDMVEKGMSPSYISTKIPITATLLEKLIRTGYKNVIQISLDSTDEINLHKIIMSPKGYVKEILEGIHRLDENGFKIQVDTILTRYTASIDNLKSLADILSHINNFVYWEIRVPEYSIYSPAKFNEAKCTKSQIDEIDDYINNYLIKEFPGKIIYSYNAVNEKLYCGDPSDSCFDGGQCGFLQNQMFILPDGKVSACEQLYWHPKFIIGDLMENSIEEIWQSNKALTLFNITSSWFRDESICSKCNFIESCLSKRRRCVVKTIKAYGVDNWDYPDPRCKFAPKCKNEIEYL